LKKEEAMGYHNKKGIEEEAIQEICRLMHEVEKALDLKRLQCVYLRSKGLPIEEIADLTQFSISHIKRVWTSYFSNGLEGFLCKPRGGRHRYNLDIKDEISLLEKHSEKAGEGRMLKVASLHNELCELSGKKVALSTAYRLAKRHGWRKIAPRPFHPKREGKKAIYFKTFFS
jgi:transposase